MSYATIMRFSTIATGSFLASKSLLPRWIRSSQKMYSNEEDDKKKQRKKNSMEKKSKRDVKY